MVRIAVGGLKKKEMEQAVLLAGKDKIEVIVTSDVQAGQMLKKGEVDYYFGACNSGGGAAIAILIGMLGYGKCCTVAKAGHKPEAKEIKKFIEEGKIAFGMSVESIDAAAPMIIEGLLAGN